MKKIYTLIPAILFALIIQAQNPITNSSFETWSNGVYPDGCSNSSNLTKSTTAHTGQFAAKGEKLSGGGSPQLSIGGGNGFPVSVHYTYLNFYYIFNKVGTEAISVTLYLDNDNTAVTVGGASPTISTASSTYQAFSVPISYTGTGATSGTLDIVLQNNTVGSYFIIDDISLSTSPLAVEEIEKESSTLHVYPNPALNTVQIHLDAVNGKATTILLTDITGKTIRELNATSNNITVDISDLPSGNYIVAVKNDEMIQTKRLVKQ